ncbi:MAG TPA: hypothetical protein VFZ96_00110, partial [Actinomycetota bacterium]|nr:hypothetical protein [Actinomycetota bacterium]
MNPWVRLLGVFAAVVAAALLLKVLHPLLVLALLIGGVAYANHVLTVKPKRERTRTTAALLGLRAGPDVQAAMSALPFALLERPRATTSEVMAGPWRGTEVRLFDLETMPSVDVGVVHTPRRFTCAVAPLPIETPHLVAEPEAFLTSGPDHADLPAVTVGDGRIDAAYDIRCEQPGFAASFVAGDVARWLLEQDDAVAFETRGRA